jgi:anti-anti-sigma factor
VKAEAVQTSVGIVDVEVEGDTMIITPVGNLSELAFREIESWVTEVLALFSRTQARNVIMDFTRTDYYGSTALGCLVRLREQVRNRGGRMALCNVSEHEREILRITGLHNVWPICSSREEALAVVRGEKSVEG